MFNFLHFFPLVWVKKTCCICKHMVCGRVVENLDPSNRFVKGSGFVSPSANSISLEALNMDIMLLSFIWAVVWVWYPEQPFPHFWCLLICKCCFTDDHWQHLSLPAKPPVFRYQFILLLLSKYTLPLPPSCNHVRRHICFCLLYHSCQLCFAVHFLALAASQPLCSQRGVEGNLICTEPITALSWGLSWQFSCSTWSTV